MRTEHKYMRKKIIILWLFIIISSCVCYAQDNYDISAIDSKINQLSKEINTLKAQGVANDSEIKQLKSINTIQQVHIDSLEEVIKSIRQESLDSICSANQKMRDSTSKLTSYFNAKYMYAIALGILALLIVVVAYFVVRRKAKKNSEQIGQAVSNISKLELEQKAFDNSIIDSDTKLMGLIEKQLEVAQKIGTEQKEVDHSLAIAVANELARIKQNLNHMDSSVKGVSQLKNRSNAIMATLNSKQYEIPELLGRVYHDGDIMIATMELNEEMKPGTNRIKRVIKPQVSYAGKLIQPAEVVVEFNE